MLIQFFLLFLFHNIVCGSLSEQYQKLLISVIEEDNKNYNLNNIALYTFSQNVNQIYDYLQDSNSDQFKKAAHGNQSCFVSEDLLCKELAGKGVINDDKQRRLFSLLCQSPYKEFFIRHNVQWVLQSQNNLLIYQNAPVNYPNLTGIEFFVYNSGLLPLPYLCPKTFSMHPSGGQLYCRQYGLALLQKILQNSSDADVGIFYQKKHVSTDDSINKYVQISFSSCLGRQKKRFYISCEEHNHHFKTILYDVTKKEAYWFEPVGIHNRGGGYIEKMGFRVLYCSPPEKALQNYYNPRVSNDLERSCWDKTCFIKSLAFAQALVLLVHNEKFLKLLDMIKNSDKAAFMRMAVNGYMPEYFEPLAENMIDTQLEKYKRKGLQVKNVKEMLNADLQARWSIFTACFLKAVEQSPTFTIDQAAINQRKQAGEQTLASVLKIQWAQKTKFDEIKPVVKCIFLGTSFIGCLCFMYWMLQGKLQLMQQ